MDASDSSPPTDTAPDRVFDAAADLFRLLSKPIRLRIVCVLCAGECNVGELLDRVSQGQDVRVRQPNLSQHLGMLYRGGIVGRRRSGAEVFYRVVSKRVLLLCEAVCHERKQQQAR